MASDTSQSHSQREEFSCAQLAAPTRLAEAGRACSARELAGGTGSAPHSHAAMAG